MKRINVTSSSIKSIGYELDGQILEVEFTKWAIYQYKNVQRERVLELIFADSIGSFFMKNIAKNYQYEQVNK